MSVADLQLPSRLLAGGGPGMPDPRVLRAMAKPLLGQFDPDFTAIMDDVMELARRAFLTSNQRCFPVSGLAAGGLEAIVNSLVEDGDCVAIGGSPRFVADVADIARRNGAQLIPLDELGTRVHELVKPAKLVSSKPAMLAIVPLVDPTLGTLFPVDDLARACHSQGVRLVVDATLALGGCELRVDDWAIDACVAGVDYAVGAPSGMALVTYSPEVEALMHARRLPPRTSYLDLLQLQAYWSPERLNHHTAPTSLVYGLREALRLIDEEGLQQRWNRHRQVGMALRQGLESLGLEVRGDGPYAIVRVTASDEASLRRRLLDEFGIHVRLIAASTWRLGLLGADARPDSVARVLTAIENVFE